MGLVREKYAVMKKKENRKEVSMEICMPGTLATKKKKKSNAFLSSSLSLLIFYFLKLFLLLHSLKLGNHRKSDANWATCPSENNLVGSVPRVGSAQGWIRSPICCHSQHESPAANKPMLLTGQGLLLGSAGSSAAWLSARSCDLQPAPVLA